jgi:hypothetical protein
MPSLSTDLSNKLEILRPLNRHTRRRDHLTDYASFRECRRLFAQRVW